MNSQAIPQLWSGKWCIKDEHKLLSELGGGVGGGCGGNNNDGSNAYYDHQHQNGGFASDGLMYESITTTISPTPHSTIYTPPIGKCRYL